MTDAKTRGDKFLGLCEKQKKDKCKWEMGKR